MVLDCVEEREHLVIRPELPFVEFVGAVEKVQAKVKDERADRHDSSQTRSITVQVLQRFKLVTQILVEWLAVVLQAVEVGFRKKSTADCGRDE